MLTLAHRSQKSILQYLAGQALTLSRDIADSSLTEHEQELQQALDQLSQDRRILLFGRAKSGKSSVLAALINEPVIARAETRERIARWRTCPPNDGPDQRAHYLMRDELAGFEFIDTADCQLIGVEDRLPRLVEQSDIALAVVNSHDIENPIYWKTLAHLVEHSEHCRFAIVATHVDSLNAMQLLRLKGALQDGIRDYLPEPLPCFRLGSPDDIETMDELRAYVQHSLDARDALYRDLINTANACQTLLQKHAILLAARQSARHADTGFLQGIDREIDRFLERQLSGVESLTDSYMQEIHQLPSSLCAWIRSHFNSFFVPSDLLLFERVVPDIESQYYSHLRTRILERQEESDRQFVLSCESHWNDVGERMQDKLHCDIGSFQNITLSRELGELHRQLLYSLHCAIQQRKLRASARQLLLPQAAKLYPLFILICMIIAVAGIIGFYEYDLFAVLCLIGALLIWLIATTVQYYQLKSVGKALESLILDVGSSIEQSLQTALGELVLSRVAAYRQLYKQPREALVEQERMLVPLTHRQRKLYQQFSAFRRSI